MTGRFAAFSFVDRITSLELGTGARGQYTAPPGPDRFAPYLVAESVGQLAAWVAMASVDFRRRPLAGLAGETRFLGEVRPGETVDLTVELDTCREDAIAYRGRATVARTPILELARCVGPMVPAAELDAPEALRADFERLQDGGAPAGRFHAPPEPVIVDLDGVPGEWRRAELRVPATAPLFADHFPRRPVLPGTLLLEAHLGLALRLAGETLAMPVTALVSERVTNVKLRALVEPGAVIEMRVDVLARTAGGVKVGLAGSLAGRPVASGKAEIVARSEAA